MALYNLDISKCSPKEGESISATTRYFTFRTNGDETYNVSIDKMYSKPTEITYDPSYAYKNYWTVAGTSIFSYAQGNCYPDDTDITLDIGGFGCNWLSGYSIGYRISTYGYPFTMYATSNYYLELRNVNSEARRNLLSSLHSGDLVAVYPNGSWMWVDVDADSSGGYLHANAHAVISVPDNQARNTITVSAQANIPYSGTVTANHIFLPPEYNWDWDALQKSVTSGTIEVWLES